MPINSLKYRDGYTSNVPDGPVVPLLQRDPNPGGVGTYGQRLAGTASDLGATAGMVGPILVTQPELWPAAAVIGGAYLGTKFITNLITDASGQKVDPQVQTQMADVAYQQGMRRINSTKYRSDAIVTGRYVPDVD